MVNIKDLHEIWYLSNNHQYKYEMFKEMKDKEIAFIAPKIKQLKDRQNNYAIRYMKLNNVQQLSILYDKSDSILNKMYFNIYMSCATYKDFPMFPFNQIKKKTKVEEMGWRSKHHKKIVSYDFFLDIDCPDIRYIMQAHKDALHIKQIFDAHLVPYQLIFSGEGFHFIVKNDIDEYSFNPYNEKNIYKRFAEIARYLYDNVTEFIDLSVYDSRRVRKVPYSLASYDHGVYMCYPFEDHNEFYCFDLEDMKAENIGDVRGRGTHIFNQGNDPRNLFKVIKDEKG